MPDLTGWITICLGIHGKGIENSQGRTRWRLGKKKEKEMRHRAPFGYWKPRGKGQRERKKKEKEARQLNINKIFHNSCPGFLSSFYLFSNSTTR